MEQTPSRDYLYFFPKETMFPGQQEAMDKIHEALTNKQIFFFEGAPGTGKTLSALAPALGVAMERNKTVVIATPNHQQMEQFVNEAKGIKKKTGIDVVVLKRKALTCPKVNEDNELKDDDDFKDNCSILKENTDKFYKDQKKHAKLKICRYYLNSLNPGRDNLDKFKAWYFSDVRRPEELLKWGIEHKFCGYEFLKLYVNEADLLVCNYRHILDPHVFIYILKLLKKEPEDLIVIFDEAHNIESHARDYISEKLSEDTVERGIKEIREFEEVLDKDAEKNPNQEKTENFLSITRKTMVAVYEKRLKIKNVDRVSSDWMNIRIVDPEVSLDQRIDKFWILYSENLKAAGIQDLPEIIEVTKEFGKIVQAKLRKPSRCIKVARFMSAYRERVKSPDYYPIMSVRSEKGNKNNLHGRLELYNLFPKIVTGPLFQSLYGAVLMSATLQPFDILKTILDIKRDTSYHLSPLLYPKNNRLTIAVPIPALFSKNRDNPKSIRAVTQVLDDIIESSDGNVLIFFQNYREAVKYKKRFKCKVSVFINEKGKSAQAPKEDFFKTGESGNKSVLISYLWGPLAEGVDFKDARGRIVVIVGVPYPHLDDKMLAVQTAYEAEFGNGWEYAFGIPTIRKVRQAVGRVVRSPDDYGIRILLDERYSPESLRYFKRYSVVGKFPCEESAEIVEVRHDCVKSFIMNFFKDHRRIKT